MPSGNKVIGHILSQHLNIEIYISSKTVTQGLCGSFDNDMSNDLFNRFTREPSPTRPYEIIDVKTSRSWRWVTEKLMISKIYIVLRMSSYWPAKIVLVQSVQ